MLHSAGCVPPARGHCWPRSGRSCTGSSVSLSPWPPPQVPSGPAPAPCMPYLKEGHVLAIVLFSFLQVCAVDEGTALLGIAIACRIGSAGVNWWPPALNSPQRSRPPPEPQSTDRLGSPEHIRSAGTRQSDWCGSRGNRATRHPTATHGADPPYTPQGGDTPGTEGCPAALPKACRARCSTRMGLPCCIMTSRRRRPESGLIAKKAAESCRAAEINQAGNKAAASMDAI